MPESTTWLTYDELAARLGIERESARQLAIRKRWTRQRGNDGKARVAVPDEALPSLAPADDTGHDPSERTSDDPSHDTDVARVLTRHIERLEQALATAEEKAVRLEGERDAARDVTRQAEGEREAARADARAATAQAEALREVLAVERERAAELKSERDRLLADQRPQHRPWWRRMTR
jgi:regulator of protease activity HflC (stomatin/prohibitin superfamily)